MVLVLPLAQAIEAEEPGDGREHCQPGSNQALCALFPGFRQVVGRNRLLAITTLIGGGVISRRI